MYKYPFKHKERVRLNDQFRELKTFLSIPIYGYNSAKYDMQMILKFLVRAVVECGVCLVYNSI